MTLYDFHSVHPDQQLNLIFTHGEYLTYRTEINRLVMLYMINGPGQTGFFAEVFHPLIAPTSVRWRVFKTEQLLLAYTPPHLLASLPL